MTGAGGERPRTEHGERAAPGRAPGDGQQVAPGDGQQVAAGHGERPAAAARTVRAAGCVLWRRAPGTGSLEICLVHRPKYDDWSHPKGKLKRAEEPLAAALREVEEETGHRCAPGPRLSDSHYVADGRPKVVHYWAAEETGGRFVPNAEVDRVCWMSPEAARARLTRSRDRLLVDEFLALPRHA
ncbi:hypothetical protein GCM10010358_60520 [Streptomyces minutiscleroticus]|uniref:Nudix hydrolase domain-containing protein n=1 Tax=Streptomyces minutiscleroticus TaxID=68238 RepID=A0A918U6B7_9ACTN|nr:hypothetical protein GCM10010358_60520 [Streptomyces minutiscleroticus]